MAARVEIEPATAERWKLLTQLFGPRGACAGCWCQWWKLPRAEFDRQKGAANRRRLKRQVDRGDEPGLLALVEGEPVGWCALEPRSRYPVLSRSRVLAPVDDRDVWAVTCFFVRRDFRRQGISVRLLRAARKHAASRGARLLEGYPIDKRSESADAFAWSGLASAFLRAGFREVARRSPTRPIMRARLTSPR